MPPEILFLMLFAALAGIVQGTVGFGFGMIAMGSISLWLTPKEAVPIVALLCLVVNLTLTWRLRSHLSWQRMSPLIWGSVVGVPIGVTLFTTLNPSLLGLGLGIALLVVCAQQLLTTPKPIDNQTSSRLWGTIAGLGSGILGGAFNTGGPPALMYVGVQPWSKEQTMATLQGLFLVTCVLQIGLFIWNGTITTAEASRAMTLLLPVMLGVGFGQWMFQRIDQQKFRTILLGGIGLLGIMMLYKSGGQLLG